MGKNDIGASSGDIKDLSGLPKRVNLGQNKKRMSGQVNAGHAHIEGDMSLGKRCITALRSSGEFSRATQGFHAYPARLHPEAARILLEALSGESLGDPFCGGGTLLVEGLIAGRRVYGSDLNPIATLVSTARTALLSSDQIEKLGKECRAIAETAKKSCAEKKPVHLHAAILKYKSWYKPNCFDELSHLFAAIRSLDSELKPLIQAIFSSLVVKYSLRASDTSNKVVYIPRKNGTVLRAFSEKSKEYIAQLSQLEAIVPPGTEAAKISLADARSPGFGKVDTIITSPPYPGTYDYLLLQQLRQAWFDLEMQNASEIGSRRSFKQQRAAYEKWLKDTDQWVGACAKALTRGGKMAVVVGEGMQGGRLLRVAKPTMAAAQKAGLSFVTSASVDRFDPATRMKKVEYILVFEKPNDRSATTQKDQEAKERNV